MKRKPNKNRTRTVYPQERPDKKPKFAIKDGLRTEDTEVSVRLLLMFD